MKKWIQAARLRTLPLSVSGIIVGSSYAFYQKCFDVTIFILAIATTLSFQILSNFANDYGDGIKGTDANREGEKRLIASGEILPKQMKKVIIGNVIISLLLSIMLIYLAFGKDNFAYTLLFLFLGIASITAAIKYTVGKNAYGYSGFGDVFVFTFFGLVAVLGSNFLFSKTFDIKLLPLAFGIGFWSVAVLNLNNLRDEINDKAAGKNTLVVKFGNAFGVKYQSALLGFGYLGFYLFFYFVIETKTIYLLLMIMFVILHFNDQIKKVTQPKDYDPFLKKIALLTFFSALFIALQLYSLASKLTS
jgi:1,4-dihydroxy-2-naphthoate polyprenyltransferase